MLNIPAPRVRVELDHMRFQIEHAMNDVYTQLKTSTSDILKQVLDDFDIEAEITKQVTNCLQAEIRRQVEFQVKKAVGELLNKHYTTIERLANETFRNTIKE